MTNLQKWLLGWAVCLAAVTIGWYGLRPGGKPAGTSAVSPAAGLDMIGRQPQEPDVAEKASSQALLYVIGSKRSCDCFVQVCNEIRAECEGLIAEYGGRVQICLLDADDDRSEVQRIRSKYDLSLLPIVVLLHREGDFEDVLYKKDGIAEAAMVGNDLASWIENLSMR